MEDWEIVKRPAAHLLGDLDGLVEETFRKVNLINGQAPSGQRPGDTGDIHSGVHMLASVILGCLAEMRHPTELELRDVACLGRHRNRQHVPRDSVSETLDVLQEFAVSRLIASIETVLPADVQITAVAEVWPRLVDLVLRVREVMLDAYDLESDRSGEAGAGREAALFVDRLLDLRWTQESEIRQHAAAAGVSLGAAPALVIVFPDAKATQATLLEVAETIQMDISQTYRGGVRWEPIPHVPVVVNCEEGGWLDTRSRLVAFCQRTGAALVILRPRKSLRELAREFGFVGRGLQHASAVRREPSVVDGDELPVLSLLANSSLTMRLEFVHHLLNRVLEHPKADTLLRFIDAVYETDGSAAGAGELLQLSKNTALRRWRLVERLIGRSLGRAGDRFALFTAIRVHDLTTQELQLLSLRNGGGGKTTLS